MKVQVVIGIPGQTVIRFRVTVTVLLVILSLIWVQLLLFVPRVIRRRLKFSVSVNVRQSVKAFRVVPTLKLESARFDGKWGTLKAPGVLIRKECLVQVVILVGDRGRWWTPFLILALGRFLRETVRPVCGRRRWRGSFLLVPVLLELPLNLIRRGCGRENLLSDSLKPGRPPLLNWRLSVSRTCSCRKI